jgi:hypothetical protein
LLQRKNHLTDLLDSFGTIKETKQERERRKPKPVEHVAETRQRLFVNLVHGGNTYFERGT